MRDLKSKEVVSVSEIRRNSQVDFSFPKTLSFFNPYLHHSIKETLEVGGEAYVSRIQDGTISGLFIYDDVEKSGTVYTRSQEVFDYFYELRPFSILWSELKTAHESETYDIYTIDLNKPPIEHRFNHEVSIAEKEQIGDVQRFMALSHPGINPKWVRVAFENGDKCVLVKLQDEIAGLGWLSLVNQIGRLYSLYTQPRFRRMGIGEDLLLARLLWLRSMHAISAFSEISRDNSSSSRISTKGGMRTSGQVYQYFGKDHGVRPRAGNSRQALEAFTNQSGLPHLPPYETSEWCLVKVWRIP